MQRQALVIWTFSGPGTEDHYFHEESQMGLTIAYLKYIVAISSTNLKNLAFSHVWSALAPIKNFPHLRKDKRSSSATKPPPLG